LSNANANFVASLVAAAAEPTSPDSFVLKSTSLGRNRPYPHHSRHWLDDHRHPASVTGHLLPTQTSAPLKTSVTDYVFKIRLKLGLSQKGADVRQQMSYIRRLVKIRVLALQSYGLLMVSAT